MRATNVVKAMLSGVLVLGTPCPAVAAEGLCGEAAETLAGLEALVKSKPGVEVVPSDGTVVSYSLGQAGKIWNFATGSNPAYPSVACRTLEHKDGAYYVSTKIHCQAEKAACDALAQSYDALDRQMIKALKSNER